ncbi:hypothetical protein EYF80_055834 [Liparis tanakae]|uniref:Uncharacterized protein n=1 Tax=Liparis tanakae TaxID=230148 RepID=A0A4Z2F0H7_9TELE|nr:hypothetical protein EYF80_055834 [Liparis tanakae]
MERRAGRRVESANWREEGETKRWPRDELLPLSVIDAELNVSEKGTGASLCNGCAVLAEVDWFPTSGGEEDDSAQ